MRICIDISSVVFGTGVSTYTKNLVGNILGLDNNNEYILFGGSLRRKEEFKAFLKDLKKGNWQSKILPIPPLMTDILWNKMHILPIEKLVGDISVFHSFKVTTVHDLVPIKFPKISHPKIVSTHKMRLKWVKKEVDRIIVPSQTTSYDLMKLGVSEDKIRIIPEAVDKIFKPAKKTIIERIKRIYRISGKYILAVGVNPRKNTQRIIDAFEKIKADTGLKLVIIGHQYMDFGFKRGVLFTGYVNQENLSALYSGSQGLVYPSFYEGFGLPILEAFACNIPVVTSNIGSMKEVGGDACVFADPYSVDSISEGILKALKNAKSYIAKGNARLKNYSWKKTAEMTIKVYEEAKK